jgi:phosphoesterase RecJ-like protein
MTANNQTIDLSQLAHKLVHHQGTIILNTHRNPDGDGLGCILAMEEALQKLGRDCFCFLHEPGSPHYSFMPGYNEISLQLPAITKQSTILLTFDASNREILSLPENFDYSQVVHINVDHHISNCCEGDFNLLEETQASCSQIALRLIKEMKVDITETMATNLYTGVVFDTGRFSYSDKPETFYTAGDLLKMGADHWAVFTGLYRHNTLTQHQTNARLINQVKQIWDKKLVYLEIPEPFVNDINLEETEDLVNSLSNISDLEVMVVFKYMDREKTKVSFRSRGEHSVSDIALELGGGGHLKASGALVHKNMEETKALVLNKLGQMLGYSL